jgi:hypothetical protein
MRMNLGHVSQNLIKAGQYLSTLAVAFTLLVFSCVHPALADGLSMTYQVGGGTFVAASGEVAENLTGSFTIAPNLSVSLPDGTIGYPSPPEYIYNALSLQSQNDSVTLMSGEPQALCQQVPALWAAVGAVSPDFIYNGQGALSMAPVVLSLLQLSQGFDSNGRQYWQYSDQILVPAGSLNQFSYDGSGNYYPNAVHLTYQLINNVGEVIQAVYPPGEMGPGYTNIPETSETIGTLAFDATPVPVPAALWLFGGGLTGLSAARRMAVLKKSADRARKESVRSRLFHCNNVCRLVLFRRTAKPLDELI